MTAPTSSPAPAEYEAQRLRHLRALLARLPGEIEKPTWPLERLHALRDERLRALVRFAKERSPWHARRLRHVDPETVRGDDLSAIPPMTKADLMEHWDEIVGDRRLTLDRANAHLAHVDAHGHAYLLDEYHVVASGGSSGQRGVFAWDFEGWLVAQLSAARYGAWLERRSAEAIRSGATPGSTTTAGSVPASPGPARSALVAAQRAVHIGTAMSLTFAGPPGSRCTLPVTLPLAEIVAGLNDCRPASLAAYPSMLHHLALEARAGRLRIAPRLIWTSAEPLLAETRRLAEAAFAGAALLNGYGCSETWVMALSYPGRPELHLFEDVGVYEPLDRNWRPTRTGETSARLLVTNVINQALPLIRYELTDEVTLLDGPGSGPWTGRRIAAVEGRLDDEFAYAGGVLVHPHLFRAALGRSPEIVEYQVRQTPDGAAIAVRLAGVGDPGSAFQSRVSESGSAHDRHASAGGSAHRVGAGDLEAVRLELIAGLSRAGLPAPRVTITAVTEIERNPVAGKLKRFVPLARQA